MITRDALLSAGFKKYPVPSTSLGAVALFCKVVKGGAGSPDDNCQGYNVEVYEYDNRDIGASGISYEANVQFRVNLSMLKTQSIFNVRLLAPDSVADIENFYNHIYTCI